MEARQLIATAPSTATAALSYPKCTGLSLPAGGILRIPGMDAITLTASAAFQPACTQTSSPAIIANPGITIEETATGVSSVSSSDFRDPFYASTFPQCYALAATTVIAYTLVIMLFITPRSFLDGGVVVLGRRGFTSGGTGGTNIGGRPWLQKIAAMFVAVSLTIATVDTFRVAESQYAQGIQNAQVLQQDVLGGTELKVIRIVSEAFLWLAQAQTLIRLFPRQREKVIIKWTAFALIALGVIFDSLNSFLYTNQGSLRPRSFTDAIPALSYLFQLSLGVLYAAWVIYYAMMKKQYAFIHPQMRNMCLVALLSVWAVQVPVVFFILDIIKPEFTGWGDYVRWVGAAAASVIVWEWVERIEALEREEKKDGILGREVFDGDEMLEMGASEFAWPRKRKTAKKGDGSDDPGADGGESGGVLMSRSPAPPAIPPSGSRSNLWPAVSSIAARYRPRSKSRPRSSVKPAESGARGTATNERSAIRFLQPPLWPARPPQAVTPVSRTDTASADSTVYAVRYAPLTETTSRTGTEPFPESTPPPILPVPEVREPRSRRNSSDGPAGGATGDIDPALAVDPDASVTPSQSASNAANRWRAITQANQLFRKGSKSNVSTTEIGSQPNTSGPTSTEDGKRWDIRSRFEEFAVSQAERLRERMRPTMDTESLPVTVIPAPPRRGAALAQLMEDEQLVSRQMSNELPSLQIHPTPSNEAMTTPSATSPRMWRSYSGASMNSSAQHSGRPSQEARPRGRSDAAANGFLQPLSPVAAGKRPAESNE